MTTTVTTTTTTTIAITVTTTTATTITTTTTTTTTTAITITTTTTTTMTTRMTMAATTTTKMAMVQRHCQLEFFALRNQKKSQFHTCDLFAPDISSRQSRTNKGPQREQTDILTHRQTP